MDYVTSALSCELELNYDLIFWPQQEGFRSVVVITFASHAKGPRFETGRKQRITFLKRMCLFQTHTHSPYLSDRHTHTHTHTVGLTSLLDPVYTSDELKGELKQGCAC